MMPIRLKQNFKGFTLVELLVALMVTSIVLTAVATLAYALGVANDSSNDTAEKQARVRYATLRISELIRHSKLICGVHSEDLAIWRADENGDGQINIEELVYVEWNLGQIRLLEFSPPPGHENDIILVGDIKAGTVKNGLISSADESYTVFLSQCSNVQISTHGIPVPETRRVSVFFDLVENGAVHNYQISATLRGWAGHLLDGSGNIVSDDD